MFICMTPWRIFSSTPSKWWINLRLLPIRWSKYSPWLATAVTMSPVSKVLALKPQPSWFNSLAALRICMTILSKWHVKNCAKTWRTTKTLPTFPNNWWPWTGKHRLINHWRIWHTAPARKKRKNFYQKWNSIAWRRERLNCLLKMKMLNKSMISLKKRKVSNRLLTKITWRLIKKNGLKIGWKSLKNIRFLPLIPKQHL